MKLNNLIKVLEAHNFDENLRDIEIWKLLPLLFKIKGEPYSLDDYPQFKALFPKEFPSSILFKCGRQVGKSAGLSRSEVLTAIQIPHFQLLYVAPLQSQADRYSIVYLKEAINSCKPAQLLQDKQFIARHKNSIEETNILKTVRHYRFANAAAIQLMYAKTSADRARGIFADRIDYDEIQDQLVDHIPIIAEAITNSEWGIQFYTGTAKTTDNTIDWLWNRSSQGEWTVKCEACNHWNQATKENNVLNMITIDGVACSKCGKLLNIRNGELVHAHPELAKEFMGVHVAQIMHPAIVYNPAKWLKLVRKVAGSPSEYIIYTEVLGISHDSGVRLITQQDIDNASCLGTHKELRANLDSYVRRIIGIDWGIAEVTSFTVTCVIGIKPTGDIDVLFGKRYVGEDIDNVLKDIIKTYRSYRCHLATPDFGVGFTNNTLLRKNGLEVSAVQYTTQNTFVKFTDINRIPRWTVDRNTALSLVFWGIKNGKIKFPNKEDSAIYTADLLSPYEHVVEESSGIVKRKFLRDPAKPDDFCHALTFATILGLKSINSSLLSIVPEHAPDYTGGFFPEDSKGSYEDITSMLST